MREKKYFKKFTHIILIALFIGAIVFNNAFVYAADTQEALTPEEQATKEKEEKELKEKEEKYNDDKKDLKDDVEKMEKERAALEGNLSVVKQSLGATKRTIDDVMMDIEKKEQDIERHNAQIESLENQIILYKRSLSETMRKVYYAQSNRSISSIIENNGAHRFLERADDLAVMREKVVTFVYQVENAKTTQEQKKNELSTLKQEREALLAEHKQKESQLLAQSTAVQTEIINVDTSIADLNAKLSQVENKLSALLGSSFDTDDIVEAAKFASKKTGVRKSFILGMLVVETNLGRFTGGCTYKQSKMGDANEKIFKRVCKDLDYDYKKKKVSCAASYGIGGAMGVSQFMPTTWVGYESKIEQYTGHSPADPWSLTDGVMAMAIKLANDGATSEKGEFDAARRYYCGSNLGRSVCVNYGNNVKYWAENYKDRL